MDFKLGAMIRGHAAERGGSPMFTYGDRVITFAEMDERSSRVAAALADDGVGSQERVAFLDKNGPEYFEVLFGGGKVNAVNVAVNWRLAPPEIEYIIDDAEAKLLFVGPEFVDALDQISFQTVKKIIVLGDGDDRDGRYQRYEEWVSAQPPEDPMAEVADEDVAMQLYTSGTTGLPKGAMLVNSNFSVLGPYVSPQWGLDETSVNVVCMPLFHIGGSGWALVGIWNGCHSLLFREFVPPEILAALEEHRVTNALFVPAMLQFLTAMPGAAERDYSSLRSIVYGASPITEDVLVRSMKTFGCPFVQVYGLTETTGAITQLDAADHDPAGARAHLLRSAGRPYPHVEVRIVDLASGKDCGPGEVGELWTRSAQNMAGYWHKPDATEAVFTDDGWFKTGDAGYLDDEGFVFLTDRVKDMIVSGGENVYPAEVESALSAHPAVADLAVIGVPDERWGEVVKAVVVLAEGHDEASAAPAILDYARERLAGFKCPRSVDFVDELPRNPSGKLLKREIRAPYWEGRERQIN
jgi:long-chain acyl-CoA synthetase